MGGEASTGWHATVAMVRFAALDSRRGWGRVVGIGGSGNSPALVDEEAGPRVLAMAVGFRTRMVARSHHRSPHIGQLFAHAIASAPLLFASRSCAGGYQRELDPLARDSLVSKASAQPGAGPRPKRHRLADAA